jgi:hypothetical protein
MPILSSKKELTLNHGAPLNGAPSPFCLKAESPISLFEVILFSRKNEWEEVSSDLVLVFFDLVFKLYAR